MNVICAIVLFLQHASRLAIRSTHCTTVADRWHACCEV